MRRDFGRRRKAEGKRTMISKRRKVEERTEKGKEIQTFNKT